MKLFFDARWTRTDQLDGISRYGAELIAALAKLHPVSMIICDERQLRFLPAGVPYVVLNSPFSVKELRIASVLNRLRADVVISPMQVIGGGRRRYKLILTLHDLIYYNYPTPPQFLPLPVRAIWRLFHLSYGPQRILLNRADIVATVSQTTKQQIETHHLTKRPIVVIPNAPTLSHAVSEPAAVQKSLVYIGSFLPYKNVELLVTAMEKLPGYTLHLVSNINSSRQAQLTSLVKKPKQLRFHNGLSDHAYHQLLRSATALVSASKNEGFGLPIIEALHQGTPVICSDIPIFHEVAGPAALFFDPNSIASFVASVHQLNNKKRRTDLITKGKKQAQKFSWLKSATELLRIIKEIT